MEKLDIYSKSRYTFADKEQSNLEKANISTKNKELIKAFLEYLKSRNSGSLRCAKLSCQLRKVTTLLEKDLDKATRNDIQKVVNVFNSSESLAQATKADYRRVIRQFYKWFKDEDQRLYSNEPIAREQSRLLYKFIEQDLTVVYKKEQINPATIITEEDIEKIIQNCNSIKEKALIRLMHETGVRIGELLNMKIKDVCFNCNSARINIDGKTGMRTIPITNCVPSLSKWIEIHPFRDNLESYLWLGENPKIKYKPLKHAGVVKILKRAFKRAKLNKKCNPHWFRHSRASLLAPHLTEVLLCKYMGWTIGSRQVKTYCHLCTEQLEDAYLKIQGIETNKQENIKKITKCGCGTINENKARYCYKCGRPLSVEIAIQDEELVKSETDKTVKLLMEIMQDPELFKKFQEFKNDLNRKD